MAPPWRQLGASVLGPDDKSFASLPGWYSPNCHYRALACDRLYFEHPPRVTAGQGPELPRLRPDNFLRVLMASTPSGVLRDGRQLLEETQENVLRVDELANALLSAIRAGDSDRKTPPPMG